MVNKYFEAFKKKIEDLTNREWIVNCYKDKIGTRVVESHPRSKKPEMSFIHINYIVSPQNEGIIGEVNVDDCFARKGLGTLLMLTALYDLKQEGIDVVCLNTFPDNYKMVGLAKKVGFEGGSFSSIMSVIKKIEDPIKKEEAINTLFNNYDALVESVRGSMRLKNLQKMQI